MQTFYILQIPSKAGFQPEAEQVQELYDLMKKKRFTRGQLFQFIVDFRSKRARIASGDFTLVTSESEPSTFAALLKSTIRYGN
jgi:hypothetical protein